MILKDSSKVPSKESYLVFGLAKRLNIAKELLLVAKGMMDFEKARLNSMETELNYIMKMVHWLHLKLKVQWEKKKCLLLWVELRNLRW